MIGKAARYRRSSNLPAGSRILSKRSAAIIALLRSLACRQAQARQEQLLLLRVSVGGGARHHDGGDCAQSLDDLSRFVEPPHMRVAGREKAVG